MIGALSKIIIGWMFDYFTVSKILSKPWLVLN